MKIAVRCESSGRLAPDENTCRDCRQKHVARRKRNLYGTGPRPVLIQVPRDLYGKIKADAVEHNETVEQWILAECAAAFDDDEKEGQ